MTENYGPFDGVPWAQSQWYRFAAVWAASGVIDVAAASPSSGGLGVSFNGLTPSLAVGRAWVRGAGYEISGTAKTMSAVPANTNASLSRRDRIALRRDLAAQTVAPVLIQGTPAASPAAPALQAVETGQYDTPLFSFLVPPNSGTSITGIVDERTWLDPATGATDTGWQSITPNAPFVTTAGTNVAGCRYRVRAGICWWTFRLSRTSTNWTAPVPLFTFPTPPAVTHHFRFTKDATNGVDGGMLTVYGGTGLAEINIDGAAGNDIYASGAFPVN